MQSLFETVEREALLGRLAALQPGASRLWGKMNPAQMLTHCAIGMETAAGVRPMKQKLLGRIVTPLIRSSVFGEKPFRRNAPTDPSFVVSDARDFEAERARLTGLIALFVERGPDAASKQTHAFFGRLSGEEWGRLMHKHIDHHLRQFGA